MMMFFFLSRLVEFSDEYEGEYVEDGVEWMKMMLNE
jgi:hypothetical protein